MNDKSSAINPSDGDRIPTYEESIRSSANTSNVTKQETSSLTTRLAKVQQDRIESLIRSNIVPMLDEVANSGLFRATFALIPSDIIPLQNNDSPKPDVFDQGNGVEGRSTNEMKEELVGFRDDERVRFVRLHGEQNKLHFWVQRAVVQDLERHIRAHLGIRGDILTEPRLEQSRQPEINQKRRYFGRNKDSRDRSGGIGLVKGSGWKPASMSQPGVGQVDLTITVEEIFIRTLNEMGLFETRSGQALVIRLHVGS